jgi:hypothetical protein
MRHAAVLSFAISIFASSCFAGNVKQLRLIAEQPTVFLSVPTFVDDRSVDPVTATGLIITGDGYAITAYHVVQDYDLLPQSVKVKNPIKVFVGGPTSAKYYNAWLSGRDSSKRVALLKISAERILSAANVCFNSDIKKDDDVYVFSYPNGSQLMPQAGKVSTLFSVRQGWEVNIPGVHGSSGGPAFDSNGNVVAIVEEGVLNQVPTILTPVKFAKSLLDEQVKLSERCGPQLLGLAGTFSGTIKSNDYDPPFSKTFTISFDPRRYEHRGVSLRGAAVNLYLSFFGKVEDVAVTGVMFPTDWIRYLNGIKPSTLNRDYCMELKQRAATNAAQLLPNSPPPYPVGINSFAPPSPLLQSPPVNCSPYKPDKVTAILEDKDTIKWTQDDGVTRYEGLLYREE